MKKMYLITVELESLTDRPDLLEAIAANVISEGLAQYHALGELEPFATLKVLQSPPEELTDDDLRVRQMRDDRLRSMQRIVEKRLTYRVEESSQATLPGL